MRTAELFQPVGLGPGDTILALDAAGGVCSVALGRVGHAGVTLLAAERRDLQFGHAAVLVPMIEAVMAAAGLTLQRVDCIAVGIGPGGFTGLRIALATARGLGLALGKPVIGLSNFQASAANLPADATIPGDIVVLIDSRRAEPYAARLAPDLAFRAPPALMSPAEIAALIADSGTAIVTGDGLADWSQPLPPACRAISATADALAILRLAADAGGKFQLPPLPSYLRPPDAALPANTSLPGVVST
ncbi:MAG: tRNA (adenosine(37)-N6)-threonylcarbamoyltransferase complex dimerization subunit type 1 TsaB [Rhodospirillaceae bacterium]|nr:tRNA (adenosine(37)-N6)-threonylcarbamoyltransferase complex dimerization subunit type 1 TsaB [Rhodospirillaceae bacterium]